MLRRLLLVAYIFALSFLELDLPEDAMFQRVLLNSRWTTTVGSWLINNEDGQEDN